MGDPKVELANMVANMEANTGKPLEAWIAVVQAGGKVGHKAVVDWLKAEHGLGHGFANLVAHRTFGSDAGSNEDAALMEAMFAGPKAAIRPVYDRIADIVGGLEGVEFAPKKGYVSFRRSKQFALAQPSTKDRLDLGLNLKGVEASGRLEAAGSWNGMVSHRVRLSTPTEVDAEVEGWLRQAWTAA